MVMDLYISPVWSVVCQSWSFVLVFSSVLCFFCVRQQRQRPIRLIICSIILLLNIGVLVFCSGAMGQRIILPAVYGATLMLLVLLSLTLMSVVTAFSLKQMLQWRKRNVTPMSIIDGLDHLSTGLCFYFESGRIKLVNYKMYDLSKALTGGVLMNGADFWSRISSGQIAEGNTLINAGEKPIIRLSDGSVYSFSRRKADAPGRNLYEITAADISELYAVSARLREENEKLRRINRRMRQYNEAVAGIAREKETLNAKVTIHNEMNRLLLSTSRAIGADASEEEKRRILNMWKTSSLILCKEAEADPDAETLTDLNTLAKPMGIRVELEGSLRQYNDKITRLLVMTANETMTNAVRHGKAKNLYIRIEDNNGTVTAEYANDGIPPAADIREGGGLSVIRRQAESLGGTMTVLSKPRFCLVLKIPFCN